MRALLLSASFAILLVFNANAQTAPLTATCRDSTTWSGATRRGACSGHQGVQAFGTGPASDSSASGAAAVTPIPSSAARPQPVTPSGPGGVQSRSVAVPAGGAGQVWVNTPTKVYHCSGDRYYGKTRHGSFMTEAAAKAEGDRPSRGKTCS